MKRVFLFASAMGLAVAGCGTITVDTADTSSPELSVVYGSPSTAPAVYTGSEEEVSGRIDTSRSFHARPRNDRRPILLIFNARDEESGISLVRARIEVSYTCLATSTLVRGETQSRSITFTADAGARAADGEEVSPAALASVEFSIEDLWRRGNCTTWGQVIDVNTGRVTDITASYDAEAWNNAIPAGRVPSTTLSGTFTVSDTAVNLDR